MSRTKLGGITLGVAIAACAWCQSSADQNATAPKPDRGAIGEIGAGARSIGSGTARGAGDLAKGAGRGVAYLGTLHPIDASAYVAKGAAGAGKNVAIGTADGAGKVTKGIGRAFKHLF